MDTWLDGRGRRWRCLGGMGGDWGWRGGCWRVIGIADEMGRGGVEGCWAGW
jgi:hypothetical protein